MGKISEGRRRGIGRADLEPAVVKVLTAAGPRGMTKAEIVAAVGATTAVSVQRALVRLRGRDAQSLQRRTIDRLPPPSPCDSAR